MAVAERFDELKAGAEATNWRGRSGRYYVLAPLAVDRFALDGDNLFMLARGADVLWVGSEADVIGDAALLERADDLGQHVALLALVQAGLATLA